MSGPLNRTHVDFWTSLSRTGRCGALRWYSRYLRRGLPGSSRESNWVRESCSTNPQSLTHPMASNMAFGLTSPSKKMAQAASSASRQRVDGRAHSSSRRRPRARIRCRCGCTHLGTIAAAKVPSFCDCGRSGACRSSGCCGLAVPVPKRPVARATTRRFRLLPTKPSCGVGSRLRLEGKRERDAGSR